jgi:hypothetical protein
MAAGTGQVTAELLSGRQPKIDMEGLTAARYASRRAIARGDLDAVRHNYDVAKRFARSCRTLAVVRAMPIGTVPLKRPTLCHKADGFAVAMTKALALRAAGITSPILLLEGVFETIEMTCRGGRGRGSWRTQQQPSRRTDHGCPARAFRHLQASARPHIAATH